VFLGVDVFLLIQQTYHVTARNGKLLHQLPLLQDKTGKLSKDILNQQPKIWNPVCSLLLSA
jgi:hypothetical protein